MKSKRAFSLEPDKPTNSVAKLDNKTIVLTRPASPSGEDALAAALAQAGATVIQHPAVEIQDPESWEAFDSALARIKEFEWIVFVSRNGVRQFAKRLELYQAANEAPEHDELFGKRKVAAIGGGTASEFASLLGSKINEAWSSDRGVHLVPPVANSESLATALIEKRPVGKVLLVRAQHGNPLLENMLASAGIDQETVVVYRSSDVKVADTEVLRKMEQGEVNFVLVSSPMIATATVLLFRQALNHVNLVSVSPNVSVELSKASFKPAIELETFDIAAILDAIAVFQN